MGNKKLHILVVDDEPDILVILKIKLTKCGYEVSTANDGEKALEIIDSKKVNLILTDLRMPGLYNGVELLEEVKRRYAYRPVVVFMSGSADIEEEEAYAMGACGYLHKPLDFDRVIALIDETLKKYPRFKLRRHERVKIALNVNITSESLDKAISSSTFNLGQGGMFVCSTEYAEVGTIINFTINFKEGNPDKIEVIGEIVWVRDEPYGNLPAGYGVKFVNLTEEQEKIIKSYLKEKNPEAFIPRK